MLKQYSYWILGTKKLPVSGAMIEGAELTGIHQKLLEQEALEDGAAGPVRVFVIHAETWEEAMAVKNLRLGFGPYDPGEPEECPECHNCFYPDRSGRCFCGYSIDEISGTVNDKP